jgi:hypothetical protein
VNCPPEVPVTGERKSVKIFGAIELWNVRFEYRQDTVFNAENYLVFLEQLAQRYRRQGAILIQDNASYHKDKQVWSWFDSNRHWLEVHQLPPLLTRVQSHRTALAAYAKERNAQSFLQRSGCPVCHARTRLYRDAVVSTTDPVVSNAFLLSSMSFYLCACV